VNIITEFWEQLLLVGALIFHAARTYSQISEMRKDIDTLQNDNDRLLGWTQKQAEQIVQLRAEVDVVNRQITSMWDFMNSLRDRLNGHGK
jgi:cell division protein FtsB